MGSVRAINEVPPVVRVRDELIDAISSGSLPPKSEISIRDVADERGVRRDTLALLLAEADRDDLFTLRGTTLIVTPLDADEFHHAFALTRTIEDHLIERCCRQASPAQLDLLERELHEMQHAGRWAPTDISVSGFTDRLLASTATAVERAITRELRQATQRCINIGGTLYLDSEPTVWFLATWREIIACVRNSDVSGALRHIATNNRKRLAEIALSSPVSGSLAPVMDISSHARRRSRHPS